MSPQPSHTQLRVGRLTKAHGLKGAIKIELYTDAPERRFTPGAVFALQVPTGSEWHGKTLELAELKWYNSHPVAFFKGISDRSAAESLIKAILWIDQDLEEPSDEEDAWYDHQLVGLAVLRDGERVGTITQVVHLPAQDLLTVRTEAGDVLVPFVKAIVTNVDLTAGTVVVTPPLGLFEEIADDESSSQGTAESTAESTSEGTAESTSESAAETTSQGTAESTSDGNEDAAAEATGETAADPAKPTE